MSLTRRESTPGRTFDLTPIVDGDTLIYKACMVHQYDVTEVYEKGARKPIQEFRYKKDLKEWLNNHGYIEGENCRFKIREVLDPVEEVFKTVKTILGDIQEHFGQEPIVFLSGGENFREMVAIEEPYKGDRWDGRRREYAKTFQPQWHYWLGKTETSHRPPVVPQYKADVISYLVTNFKTVISNFVEADDELGMYQMAHLNECVMCKEDKDLDMIPGWKFNPFNPETSAYYVNEVDGYRFFFQQLLTGDRTDNIPGIYGVGKVKAEELLKDCVTKEEMEAIVAREYLHHYGDNAFKFMLTRGQLLWIMRERGRTYIPNWGPATKVQLPLSRPTVTTDNNQDG